jgi:hypothetical protein
MDSPLNAASIAGDASNDVAKYYSFKWETPIINVLSVNMELDRLVLK